MIFRELQEVESSESADYADELRATAAHLLQRQWIWKDGRGQGRYFALCEKHKSYFQKLCDALDMDWYFDRDYGYAGALPRGTGRRLDITTTLVLLIFRKMYDTEAALGRTEFGRVTPPMEELVSQFEKVRGSKPTQGDLDDALTKLKRNGLIEVGKKDPETKLVTVNLLPNIVRVVGPTFLATLNRFIDSYAPDTESSDETVTEELTGDVTSPESQD